MRYASALSTMFIGYGLINPLLSLYVSDFVGTTYLYVGAVMSITGLMKASMGPIGGFLSDKHGRKRMASLGALFISISLLVISFARISIHLIFAFILYGIGQAFFFLSIMTSMVESAGPHRRALFLGLYEGINGVSILIGSSLSRVLLNHFTVRTIFGFATFFSFLSFLSCISLISETLVEPNELGLKSLFSGMRKRLSKEYITAMYSAFLYMYTHHLFSMVMPLYAKHSLDLSIEFLPFLFITFSGSTAFGSFLGGPISDRIGRKPILTLGMFLSATSFAILFLLKNKISLVVASLMLGFGSGFFHPVASAIVADISSDKDRGKTFGFYRLIRDLGTFFGPALAGILSSMIGVDAVFLISMILVILAGCLTKFIINETFARSP
jgi:MFS family permease